jgi:uncharacterized damage-inducible protein DinB
MQPEQALTVLNFLIQSAENEHATTAKVLAAVPAEGSDYSPDPRSMKAIDLAWHIASAEIFFMTGAAAGEFPQGDGKRPDSLKTPADIVAWYRAVRRHTAQAQGHDRRRLRAYDQLPRSVQLPRDRVRQPDDQPFNPSPRPVVGIPAAHGRKGSFHLRRQRRRTHCRPRGYCRTELSVMDWAAAT